MMYKTGLLRTLVFFGRNFDNFKDYIKCSSCENPYIKNVFIMGNEPPYSEVFRKLILISKEESLKYKDKFLIYKRNIYGRNPGELSVQIPIGVCGDCEKGSPYELHPVSVFLGENLRKLEMELESRDVLEL